MYYRKPSNNFVDGLRFYISISSQTWSHKLMKVETGNVIGLLTLVKSCTLRLELEKGVLAA